jgi:hypothetical protein
MIALKRELPFLDIQRTGPEGALSTGPKGNSAMFRTLMSAKFVKGNRVPDAESSPIPDLRIRIQRQSNFLMS